MGMLIHRHLENKGKGVVKATPEPKEVKVDEKKSEKAESEKRK